MNRKKIMEPTTPSNPTPSYNPAPPTYSPYSNSLPFLSLFLLNFLIYLIKSIFLL